MPSYARSLPRKEALLDPSRDFGRSSSVLSETPRADPHKPRSLRQKGTSKNQLVPPPVPEAGGCSAASLGTEVERNARAQGKTGGWGVLPGGQGPDPLPAPSQGEEGQRESAAGKPGWGSHEGVGEGASRPASQDVGGEASCLGGREHPRAAARARGHDACPWHVGQCSIQHRAPRDPDSWGA